MHFGVILADTDENCSAAWRVLDGVVHQIDESLTEQQPVARQEGVSQSLDSQFVAAREIRTIRGVSDRVRAREFCLSQRGFVANVITARSVKGSPSPAQS